MTLNLTRPGLALRKIIFFSLATLGILALAACGREQGVIPPSLTAVAPARAITGATLPVVLTGAGFDTGAAVNVSAGVAVSQVAVVSATQINATFAIGAAAATGPVNVTVTTAGVTTNAVVFTIAPPLSVTATVPVNGATGVLVSQAPSATFSAALNCATVTATSFTVAGGGAQVAGVVSCSGSGATFTPNARLAPNTVYTMSLASTITNTVGDPMAANFTSTFTTVPAPTVVATVPLNGATGVPIAPIPVVATFSQNLNCATVTAASFTVATGGVAAAGTVACAAATATFTPAGNLAINSLYTATLSTAITSAATIPLAANYAWTFRTGPGPLVAPTVITTNPVSGATGVPLNQAVAATFNEAMDPATITPLTFLLKGPGGAAVTGVVTYAVTGSVATLTPAAPLTGLTLYTATVTTGANSLADTPMAANYTWSFTTAAAPSTTKPFIITTLPANLAIAVPTNQSVTATFSEAMNPATINGSTFTLTAPGGVAVSGLVTYAAVAESATFKPAANLLPTTTYTAAVTTGAQDLFGNALGTGPVPSTWTFTTAAAPSTTKPTITLENPAASATNVAVAATVNATFSEAMDPLTITTATFLLNDPSGVAVNGTVAYNTLTDVATFTPSANLAVSSTYTATVTTGAADLSGNTLGAGTLINPWTFTTAAAPIVPPAVNLGTASTFGGFGGGAGMTNQGINTVINGNIGTTGASTKMTGFHDNGVGCIYTETPLNIGYVNGNIYTAPPPPTVGCPTEGTSVTSAVAAQAALDALAAFNATSSALMPPTVPAQAAELGGLTLPPGVLQSASGSYTIFNGDLTLDAQGNANAVWVFQTSASGSLTVGVAGPAGARNVILINGAQAKNVYWHVGSAATINGAGGGTMVGTIIAQAGISFSTAGNAALTTLNGRALVLTGPVTMVNTLINVPLP